MRRRQILLRSTDLVSTVSLSKFRHACCDKFRQIVNEAYLRKRFAIRVSYRHGPKLNAFYVP